MAAVRLSRSFPLTIEATKRLKPGSDSAAYVHSIVKFLADHSHSVCSLKLFFGVQPEYDGLWTALRHLSMPKLTTLELTANHHSYLPVHIPNRSSLRQSVSAEDAMGDGLPALTHFASNIEYPFDVALFVCPRGLPATLTSLELTASELYLGDLLSSLTAFPNLQRLICDGSLARRGHFDACQHAPEQFLAPGKAIHFARLRTLVLCEYHPGLIEWFFRSVILPPQTDITLHIMMTLDADIQGLPSLYLRETLERHLRGALDAQWKYGLLEHQGGRRGMDVWSLKDPAKPGAISCSGESLGRIEILEYTTGDEYDYPVGSSPSTQETFKDLLVYNYKYRGP
ncbi:unnamed protein product [Peniophora sp. CBMAI 1063]|nr:unnamed protein product [Peniophora sp. CBMAI 1063]